jgi:UBX domain-containing protein 7
MDEAIDHFMAFTGSTADVARRYLGLTDNNTEQAIQLFFDSPDLASSTEPPPIPTSTRPAVRATNVGQEDASGVVHLDSDNEEGMDIDDPDENEAASQAEALSRAADYEDDEAIARRMQEELYAGGDASGGYDADGVRAPIGRRTETLVGGPDGDWPPDDMHAAVLQQMRNRQQARSCMYLSSMSLFKILIMA